MSILVPSPDDTVLDHLAAQVRANPPLALEAVAHLLAGARRQPRGSDEQALVSHHLVVALDSVLDARAADEDVAELFQEASVAVVVAVGEYRDGSGDAGGLRAFVRAAVDGHVGAVIERQRELREQGEAFVRDSRLLDFAETEMRRRLGRPATVDELAEALHWTAGRVELLSRILDDARRLDDESLLPFLDDEV